MSNKKKKDIVELKDRSKRDDSYIVRQHEDLADIRAEVLRAVYPRVITHDE
jgi:hypothetical protein